MLQNPSGTAFGSARPLPTPLEPVCSHRWRSDPPTSQGSKEDSTALEPEPGASQPLRGSRRAPGSPPSSPPILMARHLHRRSPGDHLHLPAACHADSSRRPLDPCSARHQRGSPGPSERVRCRQAGGRSLRWPCRPLLSKSLKTCVKTTKKEK